MRVVVTGITGCIGRALVARLVGDGHEVVGLVRDLSAVPGQAARADFVEVDLREPVDIRRLPATCDAVIHLAQSRDYRDFPARSDDIFSINVAAAVGLANYALQARANVLHYASTGSVYAASEQPCRESDPKAPATFYAASKLAAEALLNPYGEHIALFLPRLFYVYGPGQQAMLLNSLANRISSGHPVSLHGSEGIQLTPTFSGDVAEVLATAIEERWQGVMNIAAPEVVNMRSYCETIGRVIGQAPIFEATEGLKPGALLPALDRLERCYDTGRFTLLESGLAATFAKGWR